MHLGGYQTHDTETGEAEEEYGDIPADRSLFVQVYKPQRDQVELSAIKHGLAMALHDRGYNLTSRNSYTPDNDSEQNSPFGDHSIPI